MSEIENPWGFNQAMVYAAFNHCLGRQTYMVSICVDWIIENWDNFNDSTKSCIRRDLEKAFIEDNEDRLNDRQFKALGHDCDRKEWERVRALWVGEVIRHE